MDRPDGAPKSDGRNAPAGSRRFFRVVQVLFSAGLLIALLSRVQGWDLLRRADPAMLALALVLSLATNAALGAFKWRYVLAGFGFSAGYRETWRLWVGLYPATFFMPFQTGHALYAIAVARARNVGAVRAVEGAAYDKYLNLIAACAWIAAGLLAYRSPAVTGRTWILAASLGALVFYVVDGRAFRLLARVGFLRDRSRLATRPFPPRRKAAMFVLAAVYQGSDIVSMFLACRALGIAVDPLALLGIFPVVTLLAYAPVTFSGFGAREGLTVLLLGSFLTYDQAIAAGLVVGFLEYVAPAALGLPWLPHLLAVIRDGPRDVPADPPA
jgi:uncharacterized membrane protein YbhN (UPF0104 family)